MFAYGMRDSRIVHECEWGGDVSPPLAASNSITFEFTQHLNPLNLASS